MSNTELDGAQLADRKRRLTAPESPHRRGGPAQAGPSSDQSTVSAPSTSYNGTGSSWITPIDLTGNDDDRLPIFQPPPRRSSRPTVPTMARRQSDIVLPRWQADTDVTQCPVCKNQFTFWYRKHHCRKCGRVVCANCSPHRITMPRQFIVRPPEPMYNAIDLTNESSETSPSIPTQLWGGEEVRVCNPCVPDPNFSPPPQPASQPQPSPDPIAPENWRFPADSAAPSLRHPPRRPRNSSGPLPPLPSSASIPGHRSTISDVSSLGSGGRRSSQGPFLSHRVPFSSSATGHGYHLPPGYPNSIIFPPRTSSAAAHLPAPSRPYHNRSLLDVDTTPPLPAPPPQRQIAEEDECPICGEELPSKGPNGETTDRERHVEQCIASHLYTSTPPPRTTSAPPLDTAEGSSLTSASTSTPSTHSTTLPLGSLPSVSGPSRPRRMTGGRMLVYRATEKDCVGEDGEAAECVICFEEFEPGDEMGRLECLCRFHKVCIRQWWDTKGAGSCPTHQLHD